MNVTALFAFSALVYGVAIEWTSNRGRTFHAIVLSVLAVIAALPVTVGLIDFFTSQRPKWLRFKYGFGILLWGDIYNDWQSEEKLKPNGHPVYCNPFRNSEAFCDHRYKVSLLPAGTSGSTVPYSGNAMTVVDLQPKRNLVSTLPHFDFFNEDVGNDFEVDVDARHVTIKVLREGGICRLSLTDTAINRTHVSDYVAFSAVNLRHFFDLVTHSLDLDRMCCFVLDETRFVRSRGRVTAHCVSLHSVFAKVMSGCKAYGYSITTPTFPSDVCICLGL